jgi:predicted nucleotidyltransferase
MRRERLTGAGLESHLAAITAALVEALDPEFIILFGSFARGDQNRASDVDLVVIAETSLAFCDRIGAALEACCSFARAPVEPLVYTPAEWKRMLAEGNSFAHLVMREGRVLYERGPESGRGAAVAATGSS